MQAKPGMIVCVLLAGCASTGTLEAAGPLGEVICADLADCRARCDAGQGRPCAALGMRLLGTGDGSRDPVAAMTLFERACELGDATACMQVGYAHLGPGLAGVRRVPKVGVVAFRSACSRGAGAACTALGGAYGRGDVLPPDEAISAGYYQIGCNYGHAVACQRLGFMYELGRGVPADISQAKLLYERGCDHGAPEACTSLGRLLATAASGIERALSLFEQGCAGGDAEACDLIAKHDKGP